MVLCISFTFLSKNLTRPESEWLDNDDRWVAFFQVDVESSHRKLGSTCLDFLVTGGYDQEFGDGSYEGATARYPLLKYAAAYMVRHLGQFGTPCPATLARFWIFIRSEKCATWMEFAGVIHMESSSIEMLAQDLERISQWAMGEELESLSVYFEREHARWVRQFGEPSHCKDRWWPISDTLQLESAPAVQKSKLATNFDVSGPRSSSSTTLQDLNKIIDGGQSSNLRFPLNRQVNMVRRLQFLSGVSALTGPLKLFFHNIVRSVSAIPIYRLILIADFYQRANKLAPRGGARSLQRCVKESGRPVRTCQALYFGSG